MIELLIFASGLLVGVLFQAYRTSKATGNGVIDILRGGGTGEE